MTARAVQVLRRAAIIAVGSELLTPDRTDTNSLFITEKLNSLGIDVAFKCIAGDARPELAYLIRSALDKVDLLVLCGGLGPTDDDVTREVAAEVLGRTMNEDTAITERIRQRFAERGLTMPEINRKQAMVPQGAEILPNANGTAPGLWLEVGPRVVLLLPGPPRELKPMLEAVAAGKLHERAGSDVLARRVIHVTGRSESHVEEAMLPLYAEWSRATPPVTATILAALGQIALHLSTRALDAATADRVLSSAVTNVRAALGNDVYSDDGRSMEEVVGAVLARRGLRISIAESCTGGLLLSRLTDVPGSSRYVDRGIIAYSNEAKTALLHVPADLIEQHGAVSDQVAFAMATGVRRSGGANVGIGVTGIAGPGGGTPDKPVGTVCISVVTDDASRTRTVRFMGEREHIKFQATQAAMDMLRRMLD